jgi:hypothetical protein
MSLRSSLSALGIVWAAQCAALNSQAANHFITGPGAFARLAGGHLRPMLAQGLNNNYVDFGQLVANEHSPGLFSVGFAKIAIAVCFTLAPFLLFWVVRFFHKPHLWYPVIAMAATMGNGQFAHELYLALKKREENQSRRNEKTGETEFRRRRRKKVFNYSLFYFNVMNEMSLHSPVQPSRTKKAGPRNQQSPGLALPANQFVRAKVMEPMAGRQNLIQQQEQLLQHQTKIKNSPLPGHAPLPNWQFLNDHVSS